MVGSPPYAQHLELKARNSRLRSVVETALVNVPPDVFAAVLRIGLEQRTSSDEFEQARLVNDNLRRRADLLVRSGAVAANVFDGLLWPPA